MKKIAIFDLDGTLDLGDNFRIFLLKILIKSPQKWIYIPYLIYFFLRLFLFKDYQSRTKLKKAFLDIIMSNQKKSFIEKEAVDHVNLRIKKKLNDAVFNYFKFFKRKNNITIIASGSLDVYVKHFASELGFNFYLSTELKLKNDLFTGEIKKSNCIGFQKYLKINSYLCKNNLKWSDVTFFSDNISDIECFKRANCNYIINPSFTNLKTLDKEGINYKVLNSTF